jgi:hypothetical protein
LADCLRGEPWEADVLGRTPAGDAMQDLTPGVVLVVGGDYNLCVEGLNRPAVELELQIRLLDRILRITSSALGITPPEVRVRIEDVAGGLRNHTAFSGIRIATSLQLGRIDESVGELMRSLTLPGPPPPNTVSYATWQEWGWPAEVVGRLFRAAAAFFRAAPWRAITSLQALSVRTPSGVEWTASVLGLADLMFGLVLFEDRAEFLSSIGPQGQDGARGTRRPVLMLTFVEKGSLDPRNIEEVRSAGWIVARRQAYPELTVHNSPGAVPCAWAEDLSAVLEAVPRFLEGHRALLAHRIPPAGTWRDGETGLEMDYAPAPAR